ncbi:MAG: hypothetical protein K0U16_07305 [Gammaproteobacteria bacterium]|nr:hypothetical protein [Gammaproteobacteria bacterium]
MALPPSGYPKINGKACGQEWYKPIVVTGHIPGTGWGSQYKHTIQPIRKSPSKLRKIGSDRREQERLADTMRSSIDAYRRMVIPSTGQPKRLRFTQRERDSIDWLLDRADAYLEAADALWLRWANRTGGEWPLDLGDKLSDFAGGVCPPEFMGSWITSGPRGTEFLCPSQSEIDQREGARSTIGLLFDDALAHLYCAQYGYWQLHLYKKAVAAYDDLPTADIGDMTIEPGPAEPPDFLGPQDIVAKTRPVDPCKELGINCPPGEEPEPDDCPGQWCPPDTDGFPDPGEVPEVDEGDLGGAGPPAVPPVDEDTKRRRRAAYAIGGGAAAAIVTGVIVAVLR